jgi:hypothetical protein
MKFNGPGVKSEQMKLVNKAFSRNHAMSIHLNLVGILATIWYALACRLESRHSFKTIVGGREIMS